MSSSRRSVRGLLLVAVAASFAFVVAGSARATSLTALERTALTRLAHAPLSPTTKSNARAEIARAAHLVRTLPNGRGYHVLVALQEAAAFRPALTEPRALALYGALRANDDYFAKHWAPGDHTDIVGADGVVYRYFAGYCFRFHPLAEFGALNARASEGDVEATEQLADALVARGVYQRGGGIGWEYDFPFSGGSAPWLSGMAQAVAAQAFARAAHVVPERETAYLRAATAAYRLIPQRLLVHGNWIRLYSFTSMQVLNAQLQTVLSLQAYGADAGDDSATALATRMENATAALLPRFDTGYWSYYALPHEPSPVDYHTYVVQLLTRLSSTDARFASAAKRFAAYEKQPPAFQLANAGVGQVRFWLSKPATVSAVTAAGPSKRLSLLDGWHTLTWSPRSAGVFTVHLRASDWLGNATEFDALPIVRVGAAATKSAARRSTSKASVAGQAAFFGGAALTDPSQAPLAAQLGYDLVRLGVPWPAGAAAPDPALVASLQSVPPSLALELVLDPGTATDTSALPQYAASLAQQLPALRYLVLTQPALVAAVRATVPPTVAVGSLLAAKGVAASGDVAAVRPGIAAPASLPVLLDGATPAAATVAAAACTPNVAGVVFDSVVDTPGVLAALTAARRGTDVCPGVTTPATASSVVYPDAVTSGVPVSLQLGCVRDCLYVATLTGADRRPVVARRGDLRGGAAPATIALPKTTLGQATYTLDVRIVSRVNPGAATVLTSPPVPRS
jgi:D-glucuronyl C5-epimerase C-terminus